MLRNGGFRFWIGKCLVIPVIIVLVIVELIDEHLIQRLWAYLRGCDIPVCDCIRDFSKPELTRVTTHGPYWDFAVDGCAAYPLTFRMVATRQCSICGARDCGYWEPYCADID